MNDRKVAVTSVVAGLTWAIGLTLIVAGIVGEDAWAGLGLYFAGVGGCLTIRHAIQHIVHARQDVFDMGRDYERGRMRSKTNGTVHSLR